MGDQEWRRMEDDAPFQNEFQVRYGSIVFFQGTVYTSVYSKHRLAGKLTICGLFFHLEESDVWDFQLLYCGMLHVPLLKMQVHLVPTFAGRKMQPNPTFHKGFLE